MFKNIIFGTRQIGGKPSYNDFPENKALDLLDYVYSKGINTFDTAPIYGNGRSERLLGEFILKNLNSDETFREKITIITKFGIRFSSSGENYFSFKKESIIEELEESLTRLKTDYIDVYLLHIPDNIIDVGEVIETLNYLKSIGRIKSYGLCNTYTSLLNSFLNYPGNQIEYIEDFYNMIEKKAEKLIFPYIKEKNIKFLAYSPLYRGLLTEIGPKALLEKNENAIDRLIKHDGLRLIIQKRNILTEVANRKKISLDKLAIEFLSNNKNVDSIIFGTTKKKHLDRFLENYIIK